ncbi:MAG: methyltransferase domain-containing protein [Proteobacteria bacterium]|nr:methyltransferase domain-containing protein [Pseudomonadota bacterium]
MNEYDETTVLGGRVKLWQPKAGLRAGLDAVMVAAAVPAAAGDHVLDIGCGSGAAGLCVMARVSGIRLTGLDIQKELVTCAQKSAELNGWQDACRFIEGDVRDKGLLPPDAFDHAVCNPPYMQEGAWYESPDPIRKKQMGKSEGDARLCDWVDCIQRVLKPEGSISFIHRADHMDKLIQALGTRFGGIEIWPLYPRAGEDANRVVIRALKNRKSPMMLHQGVVLHEADGSWTREADTVLREAGALKAP